MLIDEFLFGLKTVYEATPLKNLMGDLNQAGDVAEKNAQKTNNAVEQITKKSESGFKGLLGKFGSFTGKLAMFTGGIGVLAYGIARFSGTALEWLEKLDKESADTIRGVIGEAQEAFAAAGEQIGEVFTNIKRDVLLSVLPYITLIISKIKNWIAANKELIQSGLERIKTVLAGISGALQNVIKFIDRVIGFKTALLILAGVFLYLKRAMIFNSAASGFALLMNPITWVIAAIGLVILLIDDLMTYMDGGDSLFGEYWDPIIEGAQELIIWVQKIVGALLAWWDEAGPAIMATLSTIWGYVKTVIGAIVGFIVKRWDVIKRAFAGVFQAIKGILQIFIGYWRLVMSLITGDTEETGKAIEQIWEGIKNFFVGVGEFVLAVFELLGDAIMALWGVVVDWIQWKWIVFKSKLSDIWNSLKGVVSNVLEGIKKACSDAVQWILDKFKPVSEMISGIGSALSNLFGSGGTIDIKAVPNAVNAASKSPAPNGQGGGGNNVKVDQTNKNTVNVYGTDPNAIGKVVEAKLNSANRNASRNVKSVIGP